MWRKITTCQTRNVAQNNHVPDTKSGAPSRAHFCSTLAAHRVPQPRLKPLTNPRNIESIARWNHEYIFKSISILLTKTTATQNKYTSHKNNCHAK